ncbi:hypothetical protein C0J52_00643 [Blattella germanica]|nr:hypothetical protein C0J52_00643 [Blattella germanica]
MERNSGDARRRDREKVMVQEGIDLWKQKKQDQWAQKIQEQRELRDMLNKYSPWGRPGCGAPNPDGIRKRKLHLQGLFAEEDKKQQHTAYKVDPILRFQFNEPVRKCVDNVLRYKKDVHQQKAYKQELDALVSEKKRAQAEQMNKEAEMERKLVLGGVELVPLLARRRAASDRHPLKSTDVTKTKTTNGPLNLHRAAGAHQYTQELSQQVFTKQQRVQKARQDDVESCRRHFETWQHFWGRPGHGAPREVKVKGNIDVLLHRLPVK